MAGRIDKNCDIFDPIGHTSLIGHFVYLHMTQFPAYDVVHKKRDICKYINKLQYLGMVVNLPQLNLKEVCICNTYWINVSLFTHIDC